MTSTFQGVIFGETGKNFDYVAFLVYIFLSVALDQIFDRPCASLRYVIPHKRASVSFHITLVSRNDNVATLLYLVKHVLVG